MLNTKDACVFNVFNCLTWGNGAASLFLRYTEVPLAIISTTTVTLRVAGWRNVFALPTLFN